MAEDTAYGEVNGEVQTSIGLADDKRNQRRRRKRSNEGEKRMKKTRWTNAEEWMRRMSSWLSARNLYLYFSTMYNPANCISFLATQYNKSRAFPLLGCELSAPINCFSPFVVGFRISPVFFFSFNPSPLPSLSFSRKAIVQKAQDHNYWCSGDATPCSAKKGRGRGSIICSIRDFKVSSSMLDMES